MKIHNHYKGAKKQQKKYQFTYDFRRNTIYDLGFNGD